MEQSMNKRSLSTSNFNKNIIFIIKLVVAFMLLIGYVYHVLPQYEQGYNASLIDKVNRLESFDEPKIVLLGDSNLTFGINSEMLEDAIGMPVVNMGFHGGNGNAFHEEMAKYNVTAGDIYVLCHSNYYDENLIIDTMNAWSTIENHIHLWKILRTDDVKTMLSSFPVYLKKSLILYSSGKGNQDPGGIYSRSAFNEYGDVAVLREGCQYSFEGGVGVAGIGDITIRRINELNEYLTERGASLVVAGYSIGNGRLTADAFEFISFQEQLAEKLDCPVISNYVDYMLSYNYFFDTKFHLNSEGAELRTIQLISDLKRWQETGTDANINSDEYTDIVADANLSHIDVFNDYISVLEDAKDRYTIIISAVDDVSSSLDAGILDELNELGLSVDWTNGCRNSYVAVVELGTVVYEKHEFDKIEVSGEFDDGRMTYAITSGGWDEGCCSSIVLNGQEYSENVRGLNFVVYSNETHRIL
ncbi:MAG: hypothetical protein K2N85_06380, partial [Lachnospiraceae bacterium]|nr:hypothetical protein [Lachnospiraceae bacterium]